MYTYIDQWGDRHSVTLVEAKYSDNNRIALLMYEDGERFMTCTVNVPEIPLGEGEIAIKDYSENVGVLDFLINEKIVSNPITYLRSGRVDIPVVKYFGIVTG